MRIPLPDFLASRVELIRNPVTPRDSATIAVVRDGAQGLEVFLMRRQSSMSFAPGMYVFPGGSVHEADYQELAWAGPKAEVWAERFSCSAELAHALVVAAVRETFEETGVLLAGPDEQCVLADTTSLHEYRDALENEEITFAEFLNDRGLVLRADLIGAWSHWITPSFEPKRFDTRFFVAALPAGQQIESVNQEADRTLWAPLREVLGDLAAGNVTMLPPTLVTCQELADLSTDTILSEARTRTITPIEPRVVKEDGQLWLETDREEHL